MTQQPLFTTIPYVVELNPPIPAHQKHSPTSRAAAVAIAPRVASLKERVYAYIASRPHGATDEEIAVGMGLNPNSARPRRRELEQAERVMDSKKRRMTASGSAAVVWVTR